jgi:four helix bundle protein
VGTFKSVEDIDAWKLARELVKQIYRISNEGDFSRDFGLKDQIRRASVSIVSNIAEGFERDGNKEFSQFLSLAKGSVGEVKSQLAIAYDLGYVNRPSFEMCDRQIVRIGQMIGGLMNYLRHNAITGLKYRALSNEKRETRNEKRVVL